MPSFQFLVASWPSEPSSLFVEKTCSLQEKATSPHQSIANLQVYKFTITRSVLSSIQTQTVYRAQLTNSRELQDALPAGQPSPHRLVILKTRQMPADYLECLRRTMLVQYRAFCSFKAEARQHVLSRAEQRGSATRHPDKTEPVTECLNNC